MENKTVELYREHQKLRLIERKDPYIDRMLLDENRRKMTDIFNSWGLNDKKKNTQPNPEKNTILGVKNK